MESDASDGGGHPADKLILEKASKQSRDSRAPEQPHVFQFTAGTSRKKEKEASHKRIRHASSSDNSEGISDERLRKKARAEPISVNLDTTADDHSSHHSDSETSAQPKLDFVPPRGVILIGDDEEEVQIGMQRRARAPRYFTKRRLTAMGADSAKKCFNCGKTGHFSRDCPSAVRLKPCCICASFGHTDFNCPSSKQRCYHCNRLGHFARDCPNPHNSLVLPMICTRCGDPDCRATGQPDYVRAEGGCSRDYTAEDLAYVRCLNCFQLGHLTCAKTSAAYPKTSCHNCGERGHSGLQCGLERTFLATRERNEASNLRGLDSIRSARSDLSGRSSRGPSLSKHPSYEQSYPRAEQNSAPYWQQENSSIPAAPPSHGGHPAAVAAQPYGAPPPTYYQVGQSQYVRYPPSAYQPAPPRNVYQPQPQRGPQPPPTLQPPQQPFQRSYGQFAMGAPPPPGPSRRNRNRR